MAKVFIHLLYIIISILPLSISSDFPPLWNYNQVYRHLQENPSNTPIAAIQPELFFNKRLTLSNQSTTCERDLDTLINAALNNELWALKVFDAWGKPLPSGILKGNILWLGNYDECIDLLYEEEKKSFVQQPIDTQYCK